MYLVLWLALQCFILICVSLMLLFMTCVVYLIHIHRKYSHIPGPPITSFLEEMESLWCVKWATGSDIYHKMGLLEMLVPKNITHFFFGNLREIREVYRRGEYSHILFLTWAKQYGTVYKIFVFHKCMIILSGQNVIKEVLTHSRYPKASMTYSRLYSVCGERFLGSGLVTSMDHDSWFKRRAAINPAFHKRLLSEIMEPFNNVADKWLNKLEQLADGNTYFNMADYLSKVTLDAIGQVGFDVDFHALDDEESPFPLALLQILEGYSAQLRDPLLKLRLGKRQFVRNVQRSAQVIRSEGRRLVEKCMSQIQRGEPVPDNILSFIVKSAENNPDITVDDMLDEFCTLLIAGQETTANLLAFLLKELGDYPQVYQRMLDEIDGVLGDRNYVTYDDISQLEYAGQVIRETLRLYPPAMGTARESVDNTVLNGYYIPPGTQLVVSFYLIHHLPEYFPDPDVFRPERFHPDIPRKLFTFMPFSLGQRTCAGHYFANIEIKVLLCKFFRKFTFDLESGQSREIQETTTLRPKGGVRMTLTLRDTEHD